MVPIAALVLLTASPAHPALWFNGHSTLTIRPAQILNVGQNLTIEAWVWPSPETSKNAFTYIVSKNQGVTGYGLVTVGREDKRLEGTGFPRGIDLFGNPVQIGRWSHVAFVKTETTSYLYVNGKLVHKAATPFQLQPNDQQLCIGSSPFNNGPEPCGWIGGIKEVRIWNTARTERQIRRNRDRRLSGHEKGLIVYFPINEAKGQRIEDRTGHTSGGRLGESFDSDAADPIWVRL